jgi:sulfide:quinone oxidoreductase
MDAPPFKVVIAGGGVGALEAMLALNELAGERASIQIAAPDPSFHYRPLSVAEPFGLASPRELDLATVAAENGASFVADGLAEVETERRRAIAASGRVLPYDALLVAIGARGADALPGAITFRDSADEGEFHRMLFDLDRGAVRRIAFAVPRRSTWPLGLYELALLTAARAEAHGLEDVELTLITPELSPMEVFGADASAALAALIAEAGIELVTGRTPVGFADGALELDRGEPVRCERAVTLPVPAVGEIPGLPQQPDGFIPVDRFGAILGCEREFAVGDVTWFPIKQGGLAAQLADCAASAIAALAGAPVEPQPFRPMLRGALLTGWGPRFMRAAVGETAGAAASSAALWWPPAKIAGRYLAPYLLERAGYPGGAKPFTDLEASTLADPAATDTEHADVVRLALASADADAEEREYGRALRWLEVAEDLELYLPREYELKRGTWKHLSGS